MRLISQPEDCLSQDVISVVERSMKKHTDSLMRFLEGVRSWLSQLELTCYNLDKSIGKTKLLASMSCFQVFV